MNAKRNLVATTVVLGAFVGFSPAVRAADDGPAGEKPEQLFKTLDKNGDGKLTADEVGEDRRRFFEHLIRVADGNKDGVLTAEEFQKGLKDEPPVQAPQQGGRGPGGFGGDPGEFFKRMDTNGDGKITLDEVPEPAKRFVEGMLERAGKGKDGSLTREDFLRMAQNARPGAGQPGQSGQPSGAGRPPFGNSEELFKRWDANGDGKVTLDEVPEQARQFVERMLEAAGKGKDGSLTLDDLRKAGERFRAATGQGDTPRRPGDATNPPRGEGDRPQDGRRPEGAPRDGQGPPRPMALFFRKLDTNGDGRLSKEELSKAPALFDELDENKDGELDARELFGPPPEGFGRPGSAPGGAGTGGSRRPDAARPEGDRRSEDGRRPDARPGDRPADAKPADSTNSDKPAVRPSDSDKKPANAKRADAKGAGRGRQMFEEMDKNGDGKISKEEATGRLKDNFDRIDSNGDGFLTPDEMQKALGQLRKKNQ